MGTFGIRSRKSQYYDEISPTKFSNLSYIIGNDLQVVSEIRPGVRCIECMQAKSVQFVELNFSSFRIE
jgi:hypothetical protein